MSGAFIPLLGKSPNSPQIVSIGSNAAFGRESMAGQLLFFLQFNTFKDRVKHRHALFVHQSCSDPDDKNARYPFARHQDQSQRSRSRMFLLRYRLHQLNLYQGLFPSELVTGESDAQGKSTLDSLIGVPIPESMNRAGTDVEMATAILYLVNKKQTYANGSE